MQDQRLTLRLYSEKNKDEEEIGKDNLSFGSVSMFGAM